MRVAVLTTSYPRGPGDVAGLFVADAVEHLRARGVEVEVVSPASFRHFGLAYGSGIVGNLRRAPWRTALLPLFLLSFLRAARRAVTRPRGQSALAKKAEGRLRIAALRAEAALRVGRRAIALRRAAEPTERLGRKMHEAHHWRARHAPADDAMTDDGAHRIGLRLVPHRAAETSAGPGHRTVLLVEVTSARRRTAAYPARAPGP